jgi:hypothetical protein
VTTMQMKQHDLEPALVLEVADLDRQANLGTVVSWRIIGKLRGVVVVDGPPDSVVVDPVDTWKATLTRAWVAGETDTAGDMRVEAEAMWPGTPPRPQTFPSASSETVRFNPDLG